MLDDYKKHVDERAELNIPPLPLDADQTSELISLSFRRLISSEV